MNIFILVTYVRICHLNVLHVARFKVIITFWLTFNGFFVNVLWYLWHGTCQKSVVASSFHLFFCYQRSYSIFWNVRTSFLFTNELSIQYIIDFVRMSVFLQKTFTYIFKGFVIIFFLLYPYLRYLDVNGLLDDIILAI